MRALSSSELQQLLRNQNDLLRSAYQIADRQGQQTNWEAFKARLEEELLFQAGIPDCKDSNQIAIATCTPKTFRFVG